MVWGSLQNYHLLQGEVGFASNAYLNDHFAFICIHLKIKSPEKKAIGIKRCMKAIHEMQISNGINDRSIFSSLISMGSWLIVLLLCNYP